MKHLEVSAAVWLQVRATIGEGNTGRRDGGYWRDIEPDIVQIKK